jgi:phosphoglycerate dehydrogenase-like enzyme
VLLPELLRRSDVVSLHVPRDDSTRHLMGAAQFAQMKPGAILINTCRGPVVDEAALYTALSQGQVAAAGLDVLVDEPPAKDHPLFDLPNVTLTPHSAGPTWENWTARFRNGFDNIPRGLGRAPVGAASREDPLRPEPDRLRSHRRGPGQHPEAAARARSWVKDKAA